MLAPPGTLILSDGHDEDWVPPHVVDIHAIDSGLGADGEVIEVLCILTKLSDG
jgi:hypothetical protein